MALVLNLQCSLILLGNARCSPEAQLSPVSLPGGASRTSGALGMALEFTAGNGNCCWSPALNCAGDRQGLCPVTHPANSHCGSWGVPRALWGQGQVRLWVAQPCSHQCPVHGPAPAPVIPETLNVPSPQNPSQTSTPEPAGPSRQPEPTHRTPSMAGVWKPWEGAVKSKVEDHRIAESQTGLCWERP